MKNGKQIRFSKGNLGDAIDQQSAWSEKKSRKKMNRNSIFYFY